ncbi:isoprenyl transferase [Rhodobacteraceae bacterium RKSG542]|uniref:isoprenyl transferase n=1 Tax=Pseudovibrio flavus TaxID=2529854 RepID=UPI0012BC9A93|nr:isoprenyl transferase [Pseudovibrio flavus]MTI16666.1 isoprenyl transferase [Pseudovibrio flavus]
MAIELKEDAVTCVQSAREPGLPRHVAIIMDGNGRWAAERGLPRTEGHRRGVKVVRDSVEFARQRGIEYLTLFSFSSENWSRPPAEVNFILGLLRSYIKSDLDDLRDANVQVKVIGARAELAEDLKKLLDLAEEKTRGCTGMTLVIAFNYGARNELVRAVQCLVADVQSGLLRAEDVGEASLSARLDTKGIPDPDLIIRTSGEQRLSNFLLWQAAYAEFFFSPVNWPDFDSKAFEQALFSYKDRERRYGGLAVKAV